ncbi:uncharacterized protein LOC124646348 [Helicoverpa zea]|uniref:uncharacterized protein LOC124646348 n=1 Tax=Helicoverpa zea TaxID=7113 RepID=UPI001F5AA87E|nr:uncharacterized protein LOC124646348 [Helicoverpa zea]
MNELLLLLSFMLTRCSIISVIGETSDVAILPLGTLEDFTFPNETIMNDINITKILRYGFHDTQKCKKFERAYACIHLCLSKGYDIARSNKDCFCKCYKDKNKQKYFPRPINKWKMPTTKTPFWANPNPVPLAQVDDQEEQIDILKQPCNETGANNTQEIMDQESYNTTANDTLSPGNITEDNSTTDSTETNEPEQTGETETGETEADNQ